MKEVNISHIDSDEEDHEENERPEIFKKKAFLDQFYPPSNKQDSISIDQLEDSETIKEGWDVVTPPDDILLLDNETDEIPQESTFKKKVPESYPIKTEHIGIPKDLENWATASKEALKQEIWTKVDVDSKEPETRPDFYRIGKMLGKGAFGKVNLGMHKLTDSLVACKSINKEFLEEERSRRKVAREVAILKKIDHPNIVNLFETFESQRHFLIVMELCSGGDLLNYVRKRRKLTEDFAKYFFKQLVEALIYCHKKQVVHRDIKLDNILLDHYGRLKLCDFGVSRVVGKNETLNDQCGTPAYIAPEVLINEGYDGKKSDTWSCGVVLFAMLYGTVPFKGSDMNELHELIKKGKYNLKDEISSEAKSLIKGILETDPRKRLTLKMILSHPWLEEVPKELQIFTDSEMCLIRKEFTYNNVRRLNRNFVGGTQSSVGTDRVFTEHPLDSNSNSLMRNATTKSVILAPFNSTLTHLSEESGEDEMAPTFKKGQVFTMGVRVKDIDRQYERNNN